jgi:hypothetical protein
VKALQQIRVALRHLNPEEVRRAAGVPVLIGLAATSSATLAAMEDFLAPPELSRRKRLEVFQSLYRIGDPDAPPHFDLLLCEPGCLDSPTAFPFFPENPDRTVEQVLREREDLALPLARRFPPFRSAVVPRLIRKVAEENALFALFSSLPNLMPTIFAVGWAVAEFASDTAVLTANQIRMAFLLAAASDRSVGFLEQKTEIASIIGGAFGWRALARELAGKIPLGGGLLPKSAIAYAGTMVVGAGLERYYRLGYGLTPAERDSLYRQALESGKRFVQWALRSQHSDSETP